MPVSFSMISNKLYEIPQGYERRMQILAAVNEIFKTQTVDELNVEQICSKAGISRPTFYRYFKDKYDAINWYHYIYAYQVLYQVGSTLTWHEATVAMLQHVLSERVFYERAYLQSNSYESLVEFGERTNVAEQTKTLEANGIKIDEILKFQLSYWAHAVTDVIVRWVKNGFEESPEDIASLLDTVRPAALQKAMDEPVLKRRAESEKKR